MPALSLLHDEGSAPEAEAIDDLMTAVAAGDRTAFARLYDRTSARALGIILRVVVNRALAEEVLQEVYVSVWQQASKFTAARGSVTAWICTIAHRRAVDCVRATQSATDRDHRVGGLWHPSEGHAAWEAVDGHVERGHLAAALARLSPEQRECLDLAYAVGLSQSQIAARTGHPLGTVKSRMRAALRTLREQLPQGGFWVEA